MNTYDVVSRVVKVTRHANIWTTNILTSSQYGYDAAGGQVTSTDALGNVTSNALALASAAMVMGEPAMSAVGWSAPTWGWMGGGLELG